MESVWVTRRGWAGLFLIGAGLNIAVGLHGWPAVLAGHLNDPDSYMRLERLSQGIAQGHLVNLVARDDSGAGVMVEWSCLLDALLWLMAAPLSVFIGWRPALFAAGVALGPMGVGCLALALAFAVRPLAKGEYLWAAAGAAALLPGLQVFAAPGVVHYHILLLALIVLTFGLVARGWQGDSGYAVLAGLAGGTAIWMTPETMPFVLMIYAALLFRWLEKPITGAVLGCAAGFAGMVSFACAVDPPEGGSGGIETDRLSLVYVVLGLLLLAGALALWRVRGWRAGPAPDLRHGLDGGLDARLDRPVSKGGDGALRPDGRGTAPDVLRADHGNPAGRDAGRFHGVSAARSGGDVLSGLAGRLWRKRGLALGLCGGLRGGGSAAGDGIRSVRGVFRRAGGRAAAGDAGRYQRPPEGRSGRRFGRAAGADFCFSAGDADAAAAQGKSGGSTALAFL